MPSGNAEGGCGWFSPSMRGVENRGGGARGSPPSIATNDQRKKQKRLVISEQARGKRQEARGKRMTDGWGPQTKGS
eukprot:scaffold82917_cov33-Tisochrysis_lutea.AAC.1